MRTRASASEGKVWRPLIAFGTPADASPWSAGCFIHRPHRSRSLPSSRRAWHSWLPRHLFRITEEGLGTWAALVLSSLVFGLLHIANRGATAWSSVAIAVEAGLLLGLIYHVFRSLPLCIGIHLGWNFAQGTVYGIPVSGAQVEGRLVSTRIGPDWLTGGSFGAEASVVTVGLSLLCSLALLARVVRRQTLVAPSRVAAAPSAWGLTAG